MSNNQQDWFSSWFDTPYYHILYKHRNDDEAQKFMGNITDFLSLDKDAHILDLPCGKGRHSVYLNSLGYQVTGGDLSRNSIDHAKQFENEHLRFKVKDMRKPFENQYDAIFNLFTSFGYFEDDVVDILVLQNMKKGLNPDGILVLDFLNVVYTKENLIPYELKHIDGIDFHILKEIKKGFIVKNIAFQDQGRSFQFTERVKYLDLPKFKNFMKEVGFDILHLFGDYELNKFSKKNSERLILVAR